MQKSSTKTIWFSFIFAFFLTSLFLIYQFVAPFFSMPQQNSVVLLCLTVMLTSTLLLGRLSSAEIVGLVEQNDEKWKKRLDILQEEISLLRNNLTKIETSNKNATDVKENNQKQKMQQVEENIQISSKVIFDKILYQRLVEYIQQYNKEWGGLLLCSKFANEIRCIAAVFPQQTTHSPTYCEFEGTNIIKLRNAINEAEEICEDFSYTQIDWIHTHPNLTPFFSGKDRQTFREWAKYNPRAVGVVIDPFANNNQVKAFNTMIQELSFSKESISLEENEKEGILKIVEMLSPQMKVIHPLQNNMDGKNDKK